MELTKIIDDIQHSIGVLQRKLDELRQMDDEAAQSILLTRQEAADFVGVSLRQFDRDCKRYGIEKISTIGGIRIRKYDLLVLQCLRDPAELEGRSYRKHFVSGESEFERIVGGRKG